MTVSRVPITPLWVANNARAAAADMRSDWLVSLDAGVSTAVDLFVHACTSEGRPLLRLPLRQVLLSQPKFGQARVTRTLDRIQLVLGVEMPVRSMTVGWLLDSRSGGRRFMAWLDATQILRSEPRPGFPYRSPLSAADQAALTQNKPGDLR